MNAIRRRFHLWNVRRLKGDPVVWGQRWRAALDGLWAWFRRTPPSEGALLRMERHHARLLALSRSHRTSFFSPSANRAFLRGMGSILVIFPARDYPVMRAHSAESDRL